MRFWAGEESSGADEAERVRQTAQKNAMALKYPIVVDWDAGKIAVGDMNDVQKILDGRLKMRDAGGEAGGGGEKKGFISGLFGGSS
jgi:hypothetical protein